MKQHDVVTHLDFTLPNIINYQNTHSHNDMKQNNYYYHDAWILSTLTKETHSYQ